MLKIWRNLRQPLSLSTEYLEWLEISRSGQRRCQALSLLHWPKKFVNFGPLTRKLCLLISTYSKLTVRTFSDNINRIWSHSRQWMEILINGKQLFQLQCIPCWIQKFGERLFTNNKVLFSHYEPPKFDIALAVYDNAVAFGPGDFAANGMSAS